MSGGCCWPLWADNAKPDGRYCGEKRAGEASYCLRHLAQARRVITDEERERLRLAREAKKSKRVSGLLARASNFGKL